MVFNCKVILALYFGGQCCLIPLSSSRKMKLKKYKVRQVPQEKGIYLPHSRAMAYAMCLPLNPMVETSSNSSKVSSDLSITKLLEYICLENINICTFRNTN